MSVPRERTVAITGVAGFIGSNLADRLLAERWRVIGVDDLSQGLRAQVPEGVVFHQADVRAPGLSALFEDAGAVFHLAAKNCISDCEADPVATASVNVTGTVAVFEAARAAGIRRVVYAESSALYEGTTLFPTPETEHAPRSVYAISKAAGRDFAAHFAQAHDLHLTALRYFCVYGPRQDYRRTVPPVMAAFLLHLLRGAAPTIFGTGEKRRDFIHVDDVNDFHVRCLEDPRSVGGTFNLGSGEDHSVLDIFAAAVQAVGARVEPRFAPDLPGEAVRTCADISRARALGWSPHVSLQEGLSQYAAYLREHVLDGAGAEAP